MTTTISTTQAIADVVREAMNAEGLTVADVAQDMGVSQSTVRRRLSGVSPFLVTELATVSGVLGLTVSQLVDRAMKHGYSRAG